MAPLRLQVVVQPRALPSTRPEPTIKWLEICHGDPTIQELSEDLEAHFFARNHVPLNIKILKYLDDVELYPFQKVRDIFEDINNAQAHDKSFSTVKVYRDPPTGAELADPRRFESLPPDSFARPKKRPLPPLFADPIQNNLAELTNQTHPSRTHFPDQTHGRHKRQRLETLDFQLYTDPDRPLDSFETGHESRSRAPSRRRRSLSPEVEDSQRRKRKPSEVRRSHVATKTAEGSDPYGTPVSSQTGLHDVGKLHINEAAFIPDSPLSGGEPLQRSASHGTERSRSPEIPSGNARSSQSRESQSGESLPASLSKSNQQHQTEAATNVEIPEPPPEVSGIEPRVLQEAPTNPREQINEDNASKTPSPKQKKTPERPGRLQRPLKKPKLKTINGVKQSSQSVFDPIETSEGSSDEREQLRSTKRLRAFAPSKQTTKSKVAQAQTKKSPGGLILPSAPKSGSVVPSSPKGSSSHPQPESDEGLKTAFHMEVAETTAPTKSGDENILTAGLATNHDKEKNTDSANQSEKQLSPKDVAETRERNAPIEKAEKPTDIVTNFTHGTTISIQGQPSVDVPSGSAVNGGIQDKPLALQLQEADEIRRKAQGEFDRIAALHVKAQQINGQETTNVAQVSQAPVINQEANGRIVPSTQVSLTESQRSTMSIDEQRQYNLKHMVPGWSKQLSNAFQVAGTELQARKEQQAAIDAEERKAIAEKQRQARQALVEENEARVLARKKALALEHEAQTRKPESLPERSTGQSKQGEKSKANKQNARSSQLQQAEVANAESAKFPMPTRLGRNSNTLKKTAQDRAAAEPSAQWGKEVRSGTRIVDTGMPNKVGMAEAVEPMSTRKFNADNTELALQQVVGENNRDWLFERSPKAIYNAQRQLQLANQKLKHTKPNSAIIKILHPASQSTLAAANPITSSQQEKLQPRAEKGVKKQRQGAGTSTQQSEAKGRSFTDGEALRAAGILVGSKAGLAAKGHSAIVKPTSTAGSSFNVSDQTRAIGSSQVTGAKSSSPSMDRVDRNRVSTMTPAYPSSSAKSNVAPAETNAVATVQVTLVGGEALKTPGRSALRATPGPSNRSVSFAHDSLPSSQSNAVVSKPTSHTSGSKGGMFHRAVEESNAKKAETANGGSQRASGGPPAAMYKAKKAPTGAKQTKLTQHVTRDVKGKGKAIDPAPRRLQELYEISSASEASTYYSDESEEVRLGRPGPSSRKRSAKSSRAAEDAASRNSHAIFHDMIGTTTSSLTKLKSTTNNVSNTNGDRPVLYGQRILNSRTPQSKPDSTVYSAKRTVPDASQSTSYSDIESGSASEAEGDSASLLPQIKAPEQELPSSGQPSSQKSTTVKAESSQPRGRISSSLAPMSPEGQQDPKLARLRDDRMQSEEVDRQLQREHEEAMRKKPPVKEQSIRKESIRDSVEVPVQYPRLPDQKASPRNQPGSQLEAKAAFDHSALSKLRKAQAATQPIKVQGTTKSTTGDIRFSSPVETRGSSDSDSTSGRSSSRDQIDTAQLQRAAREAAALKENPFARFAKSLAWGKK
ncbi:MAG: hypothetical protein Q9170_006708 [Blastenia crenularia]